MKRLALALTAVAVILAYPALRIAQAAGYFPNFSFVGGAAYCAGTVTGANGTICTTTVPAGPSGLVGTEFVIADVSPTSNVGQSPQTVAVPLGLFSGGSPIRVLSPNNGGTFAMSAADGGAYFLGTGAFTTATTVTLPPALYDGQQFRASANVAMANVTFNAPTGYSLTNAPNGITPVTTASGVTGTAGTSYGYLWIFSRSTGVGNIWYRYQ